MVDQVAVMKAGGFNIHPASWWKRLPRDQRAQLIKAGKVEFLCHGETVPLREALEFFRDANRIT